MPTSRFLEGLLYFYKIQFHHLTPQSVSHMYVFMPCFEAFLDIEPHFEFFCSLYKLIPQPFFERMGRVGCANLELRQ